MILTCSLFYLLEGKHGVYGNLIMILGHSMVYLLKGVYRIMEKQMETTIVYWGLY